MFAGLNASGREYIRWQEQEQEAGAGSHKEEQEQIIGHLSFSISHLSFGRRVLGF